MTGGRLGEVWATARAERAAEVGCEPDDWAPLLGRRRRGLVWPAVALAVLAFVVVPVLRIVVRGRPLEQEYAVPLLPVVVTLAGGLHPLVTGARRARWVEETERRIRIERALRERVSIGAADRAAVTERAEVIVSLSRPGLVGWPLLALLACGVALSAGLPRWAEVGYVAVVLLGCAGALATSRRRAREARRWLADPLPRNR